MVSFMMLSGTQTVGLNSRMHMENEWKGCGRKWFWPDFWGLFSHFLGGTEVIQGH